MCATSLRLLRNINVPASDLTRQVTGSALYPEWFAQWLLEYALAHSAIIISVNYRLLPESNGLDILEDVSDYWKWMQQDLQQHLGKFKPGIEADLFKVIVHGASAGGTLAIQSGFLQPDLIKAVVLAYPGMGENRNDSRPMLGLQTIPKSVLEDHLKSMVPGKIVTAADPPDRLPIALSIVQQNRKTEFFGTDDRVYPLKMVEKVPAAPFTLILHGEDDTMVPINQSFMFTEAMKRRFGDASVELLIQPGEHGFDNTLSLDTPWLKQGLSRVTTLWLNE